MQEYVKPSFILSISKYKSLSSTALDIFWFAYKDKLHLSGKNEM